MESQSQLHVVRDRFRLGKVPLVVGTSFNLGGNRQPVERAELAQRSPLLSRRCCLFQRAERHCLFVQVVTKVGCHFSLFRSSPRCAFLRSAASPCWIERTKRLLSLVRLYQVTVQLLYAGNCGDHTCQIVRLLGTLVAKESCANQFQNGRFNTRLWVILRCVTYLEIPAFASCEMPIKLCSDSQVRCCEDVALWALWDAQSRRSARTNCCRLNTSATSRSYGRESRLVSVCCHQQRGESSSESDADPESTRSC